MRRFYPGQEFLKYFKDISDNCIVGGVPARIIKYKENKNGKK